MRKSIFKRRKINTVKTKLTEHLTFFLTFESTPAEVNIHREHKWNAVRRVEEQSEQSIMKQHESTAVQQPNSILFRQ